MSRKSGLCQTCNGIGEVFASGDFQCCSACMGRGLSQDVPRLIPLTPFESQQALERAVIIGSRSSVLDSEEAARAIDEINQHGDDEMAEAIEAYLAKLITWDMFQKRQIDIVERKVIELRQQGRSGRKVV